MQQLPITDAAIREAARAVFRDDTAGPPWYDPLLRRIDDALRWLGDHPRLTSWTFTAILAVLLASMLGSIAYRAWIARSAPGMARGPGGRSAPPSAWAAARAAATRGDFIAAAHWLYAAVLEGQGRRGRLHLHPSKTVGDYLAELRTRVPVAAPAFDEFARHYERVAYGDADVDAIAYTSLESLATRLGALDG